MVNMDIDLGLATFKVDTILSAGISLIVALLTTIAFHFIESPRLEARREHYKAQFELAHELAVKLGNVAAVMQTIRDREATLSNHRSTISEKYVKTIEEMDPGNARMPSS